MNSAIRIRTYSRITPKRCAELPYLKYAAQPLRNALRSPTTTSVGSSNRQRSVNSRIRSRACRTALSAGQRARKENGRRPWRAGAFTNR
jgi:hypothetical protein